MKKEFNPVLLLAFMALISSSFQAPTTAENSTETTATPGTDQPPSTASNTEYLTNATLFAGATLTSCPGYVRGNPNLRDKTGCTTGTQVGTVSMERAFGSNGTWRLSHWNSCDLPKLPKEK